MDNNSKITRHFNDPRYYMIVEKIIWIIIFAGLFCFLYVAHPLILSDADDWYYASYWRRPLPIFRTFNSIKVFPETLFPLCSMIAANIVMPFLKDYLMSLAFVYGMAGAIIITIYVYLLARLIENISDCNKIVADFIGVCFMMLHFLMYKNAWTGNVHLFWAYDVTCFFHYTLSAVLAACVVLYFVREETVGGRSISQEIAEGNYGYLKSGLLILIIYLAIFSNSFTNVILSVFSGIHMLRCFFECKQFKETVKANWIHLLTILVWILAVFFQMFDLRNDNARSQGMAGNLIGAVRGYALNFASINKMALLIMLISVLGFVAVALVRRKEQVRNSNLFRKSLFEVAFSFIGVSIYLVLLSGVANPAYIGRTDVKIGIFFYLLLAISLMLGFLINDSKDETSSMRLEQKIVLALLPLMTFVLTSQTLNYCKSYSDFNMAGASYEQELVIQNGLIDQFKDADEAGVTEFELHVPYNPSADDNWPYPDYAGGLISDALFRHGVISRPIKAKTVFDK